MIGERNRCLRVVARVLEMTSFLAIFKRTLSIAALLSIPTLASQANAQTESYLYNPNHFVSSKIISTMKTPHSDLKMLSAHRGLHAIYGDDPSAPGIPENSLAAVGAAAKAGLELMELDVKLTSDGIPILSHDTTWGRQGYPTSAAGIPVFNPFGNPDAQANANPYVNSMTVAQAQSAFVLRDSTSYLPPNNPEPPPTLAAAISYFNVHHIAAVLALDVKDESTFKAAWQVVKQFADWHGGPFSAQVVWKVNGGLYKTPADFRNAFSDTSDNGTPDWSLINFWPNYNTGQIGCVGTTAPCKPTNFGSEQAMINSLNAFWADTSLSVVSAEITQKQPGGILDQMRQQNLNNQKSVAEFSYFEEWIDPNDPNHTPQIFYTGGKTAAGNPQGGACCLLLSHYYYIDPNNPNPPFSDTADLRNEYNFVVNQANFYIITDDSVLDWERQLEDQNLRTLSYMQEDGYKNPCDSGSAYPGCDVNKTTVYTYCAAEGGSCSFAGARVVAFGANGEYNYYNVTNHVNCDNATLGPDPIGNVPKACYFSPPIPNSQDPSVYCADEGGTCSFDGTVSVRFGADYTSHILWPNVSPVTGQIACTFAEFGYDPSPGVKKICAYRQFGYDPGYPDVYDGPAGYIKCAHEGQTCRFAGAARIAFGVNGDFNSRTFPASSSESSAGGAPCTVAEFDEPHFGVTKSCYYQYTTPVSQTTGTGGTGGGGGSGTSTCDIYASGGTPCVAAHSTVRALFGGYSGRLYQVQRSSDNTTRDIGTLSAGGYADAAAQDSFCAGTGITCTITMVYDQTSNHNDLPVTPGDSPAVANALPISVNGNQNKAYGVKVTPGVGYRNNATRGVATGSSPEGMYMVTSGTYVNGLCCFDYGNAEKNSGDNGNGHMDAINFGTACLYAPCSGSGPWVEADLENGQFMGNCSSTGDQSINSDFVTAMLKNDGKTTFALKAGNAGSGGLTTEYSGSLPTCKPGYIQMSLEGAIILGTGGDNSDAGQGSFFEGAMTSGYPTDATESAVQANIISAGYTGDSSGGSGSGGSTGDLDANEPPGPYTGPSDPGGPGPQDGFAEPAAEQPNDIMATKPALASFNGSLYVAFQGLNASNDLYVTSSSSGSGLPTATRYTNIQMGSAPAIAEFNNQLYVAFQGYNAANDLYVTSSSSGSGFPTATRYTDIQMGGAPALAVFNNQLYAAFQANDPGHTLHVTSSSDGQTWPIAWQIPNVQIGSDPAMAVFNGKLYVAFRANDPSNDVWIASSSDGVNFSSQVLSGQTMGGSSTPALVASNGVLYYIYGANDSDNEMLVSATTDGSTWQGPKAYLNDKMSPLGPGATAFGNGVSVGFQSNDSRNVLFVTNKVTEASVYTGPSDPGGPGPQDGFASPAIIQPNDVMATKPAFAAFQGSLYAAFQGVNANNNLYVTSSSNGNSFPAATRYSNIQMGSAPAMAEFNNQLYVAFQGYNASNDLYVTSSSNGSGFPTATRYTNIQMGGAPAMAQFNHQLFIAFQANDPGHTLHVTSSSDGQTWPTAWQIPNVRIGSDPAMAVFNGKLYIAFRADDPSNDVWIASSSDGVNFSSQVLSGQTMGGSSAPALAVSNCTLYYIYGANDQANEMLVSASTDGSTWQGPKAYLGVQMGATGPGATGFGHGVSVGFQSNDSRNVLFVTNVVGGGSPGPCQSAPDNSTGTYLQNSTDYPRLVRLSHGSSSVNGQIIASTNDHIFRSTDGGNTFSFLGIVPVISGSIEHCCATLYELPQNVGNLQAGTLLFAGSYFVNTSMAIEVYKSTDQGQTWSYLGAPVTGGNTSPGHGLWEPQFEVANDGALVMFWSDETDSCCSQKLAQIRTYNGTTWQDQSNTVASTIQSDRPGMAVVSKLPSGVFFMSYELCGPAACTVFYRTSVDGWNFGNYTNTGTKVQTASGQYFEHAPTNAWTPSVNSPNGALLLIGQVMFESNGTLSSQNGETIFVNYHIDGSGPWSVIPAPVQVPGAYDNYCPNYSSALLPSSDGLFILELASDYNNIGQCVSYYSTSLWQGQQ